MENKLANKLTNNFISSIRGHSDWPGQVRLPACNINKLAISFSLYLFVSCFNSFLAREARTEKQAQGGGALIRVSPG